MNKLFSVFVIVIFAFSYTGLDANPKIKAVHTALKNSGNINYDCNTYCHGAPNKIEKLKGQKYLKNQPKFASLKNNSKCNMKGCHN